MGRSSETSSILLDGHRLINVLRVGALVESCPALGLPCIPDCKSGVRAQPFWRSQTPPVLGVEIGCGLTALLVLAVIG